MPASKLNSLVGSEATSAIDQTEKDVSMFNDGEQ